MAGLVDRVIEQGSTPQNGVLPEQDAVDAGKALLRGVGRFQVVLLPARVIAPWLVAIVYTTEIMGAWWNKTRSN